MNQLKYILIYFLFLSTSVLSQSVLILEDDGTEDSVYAVLTSGGINTTLGGNYWEYTGAGINQYGLVIFLCGVDYGETMDTSVQQIIRNYVFNGGKLFTTEWISYGEYDYYPLIYEILPVVYNGDWDYNEETYYKQLNHPISLSLPDSFVVTVDWSYSFTLRDTTQSKQALTIFKGSESGDAVVLGKYGSGEIIHWNMAGHYDGDNIWSPEIKMLLINIVRYMLNIVNINEEISLPETFELYQNYPNPFNPSSKISWQSPVGGHQVLKVFDVLGREVATLIDEYKSAGRYEVEFSTSNIKHQPSSGVYFYQLRAGEYVNTKKMILIH
jgi:hypothetical protein